MLRDDAPKIIWLPYSSFQKSVSCLDQHDLELMINRAAAFLNADEGFYGLERAMWEGHKNALRIYLNTAITECEKRGKRSPVERAPVIGYCAPEPPMPTGMGNAEFHKSHRWGLLNWNRKSGGYGENSLWDDIATDVGLMWPAGIAPCPFCGYYPRTMRALDHGELDIECQTEGCFMNSVEDFVSPAAWNKRVVSNVGLADGDIKILKKERDAEREKVEALEKQLETAAADTRYLRRALEGEQDKFLKASKDLQRARSDRVRIGELEGQLSDAKGSFRRTMQSLRYAKKAVKRIQTNYNRLLAECGKGQELAPRRCSHLFHGDILVLIDACEDHIVALRKELAVHDGVDEALVAEYENAMDRVQAWVDGVYVGPGCGVSDIDQQKLVKVVPPVPGVGASGKGVVLSVKMEGGPGLIHLDETAATMLTMDILFTIGKFDDFLVIGDCHAARLGKKLHVVDVPRARYVWQDDGKGLPEDTHSRMGDFVSNIVGVALKGLMGHIPGWQIREWMQSKGLRVPEGIADLSPPAKVARADHTHPAERIDIIPPGMPFKEYMRRAEMDDGEYLLDILKRESRLNFDVGAIFDDYDNTRLKAIARLLSIKEKVEDASSEEREYFEREIKPRLEKKKKEWIVPGPRTKPTLVVDFDGVIHRYTSGWHGATEMPDGPVPGTKEAIQALRTKYKVIVSSSRANSWEGHRAIVQWLKEQSIEVDDVAYGEKPGGVAYIDDRAIRFHGSWDWVSEFLEKGAPRPWNKLNATEKDVGPGHAPASIVDPEGLKGGIRAFVAGMQNIANVINEAVKEASAGDDVIEHKARQHTSPKPEPLLDPKDDGREE